MEYDSKLCISGLRGRGIEREIKPQKWPHENDLQYYKKRKVLKQVCVGGYLSVI
jgi:hypothetical protein